MVLLQNLVDETPSHSLACSAQETIRQEVCNVLTYGLDIFVPSIRHQAEVFRAVSLPYFCACQDFLLLCLALKQEMKSSEMRLGSPL